MNGASLANKTLEDLYSSIIGDPAIPMADKVRTINDLRRQLGASPGMSLQALLPRLVGLGLGVLLSRYFGFGLLGSALSSGIGYGAGAAIGNAFPHPRGELRDTSSFSFKGAAMIASLDPQEKTFAVKLGALMALRLTGVLPAAAVKQGGISDAPIVGLGATLGVGALLGAGAHMVDRATSPDGVSEAERLKRIQYLIEAADKARDENALQLALQRRMRIPVRRGV